MWHTLTSTSGARIVDHAFKHLSGSDDGLSGDVGLADHHLLSEEDLLGRDLHAQIAASNHDTIGGRQNVRVVLPALLVLDLADNFDIFAFLAKQLANSLHIAGLSVCI